MNNEVEIVPGKMVGLVVADVGAVSGLVGVVLVVVAALKVEAISRKLPKKMKCFGRK